MPFFVLTARVGALLICLATLGCDGGPSPAELDGQPATDAGPTDQGPAASADQGGLDSGPVDAEPDAGPADTGRVALDLDPFLTPIHDAEGMAYAHQISTEDQLIPGEASLGRLGDYGIGNDRVRFVIEGDTRSAAVCGYGGNIIDGSYEGAPDVVGEVCLFLNLGQTLVPDTFEILADGGDGEAAVVAVTGHLALLDFINLDAMIGTLGLPVQLGTDTDRILPITITQYFILRPGDTGVRVVTAIRNDSDRLEDFAMVHAMDSGGAVQIFNPSGPFGGFGSERFSPAALSGSALTMVGFFGAESTHLYVPEPVPELETEGLPAGGAYVTVSGVAVALLGTKQLAQALLAQPAVFSTLEGIVHLPAGEIFSTYHWQLVGSGAPSTVLNAAWSKLGVDTELLSGRAIDDTGAAISGVAVAAVDGAGRALNIGHTDADGAFEMRVPAGAYTVRGFAEGRTVVEIDAQAPGDTELDFDAAGLLVIDVTRPGGDPTPARVHVACVGDCPVRVSAIEADVNFDGLRDGVAAVVFTGVDGHAEIPLAPGHYTVTVSRGPEWSAWPPTPTLTGGNAVEIVGGQTTREQAEIAHVVQTDDAVSADFHVHSVRSADSPISPLDRVRSFMGEGVDLLVSTDHNFISDYAPTIEALGATAELRSMVGLELTTFTYGHYNGFPLRRDPTRQDGGAYDWANPGPDGGRTPLEIFDWIDSHPGEQVVQINHPDDYFETMEVDLLRGVSYADPSIHRIIPRTPDPVTGNTFMFSDDFTAMEVLNGSNLSSFNRRARWWMTMIGRGFSPVATAVSDTHKLIRDPGGSPRTWTFTAPPYDEARFIADTNAGRVIGGNGPFFRVSARNAAGETAGLGDTLTVPAGETARFSIALDLPEWMSVDTLQVFTNLEDAVLTAPGESNAEPIPPSLSVPIVWDEARHLLGEAPHRHWVQTVEVALPIGQDAYVIFTVRALEEGQPGLYPISADPQAPFAFSNPVFIDADGGGYDTPILQARAAQPIERRATPRPAQRAMTPADLDLILRGYHH